MIFTRHSLSREWRTCTSLLVKSRVYSSIKQPKLGLLVILKQEIESGVYVKKINGRVIYDLCYT